MSVLLPSFPGVVEQVVANIGALRVGCRICPSRGWRIGSRAGMEGGLFVKDKLGYVYRGRRRTTFVFWWRGVWEYSSEGEVSRRQVFGGSRGGELLGQVRVDALVDEASRVFEGNVLDCLLPCRQPKLTLPRVSQGLHYPVAEEAASRRGGCDSGHQHPAAPCR